MEQVKVSMELVNEKLRFLGTSEDNPSRPVSMDYAPPLGDGEGFLGLELLLISFAGCVSTAIVFILRRMGKTVSGYRMRAAGTRREAPLSLEAIDFEIEVDSPDIGDELESAILRAEQLSPVWLAIKGNVRVAWRHKVQKI